MLGRKCLWEISVLEKGLVTVLQSTTGCRMHATGCCWMGEPLMPLYLEVSEKKEPGTPFGNDVGNSLYYTCFYFAVLPGRGSEWWILWGCWRETDVCLLFILHVLPKYRPLNLAFTTLLLGLQNMFPPPMLGNRCSSLSLKFEIGYTYVTSVTVTPVGAKMHSISLSWCMYCTLSFKAWPQSLSIINSHPVSIAYERYMNLGFVFPIFLLDAVPSVSGKYK